MVEQAFKVTRGSILYNEYFESLAEKQKMHELARQFFEKHDLLQSSSYRMSAQLALELTDEQREQYAMQLKTLVDIHNLSYFKKSSPMYKEWQSDVISKVDLDTIDKLWCWHWPYIDKGSYTLWHYGEDLYGYLSDCYKETLNLSDYMEPIKMSEYYAIQEAIHDDK